MSGKEKKSRLVSVYNAKSRLVSVYNVDRYPMV